MSLTHLRRLFDPTLLLLVAVFTVGLRLALAAGAPFGWSFASAQEGPGDPAPASDDGGKYYDEDGDPTFKIEPDGTQAKMTLKVDQGVPVPLDAKAVIVAQNLQSRTGEIDLVAVHGDILVFVEVRARGSLEYGGAAASVNRQKQRRLIRTAQFFLPRLAARYFRGATPACRFDVVSLEPGGTVWIKDAFTQ